MAPNATKANKPFNPYPLHFGNITQRHFWKQNPKLRFCGVMTSYLGEDTWRHTQLKVHRVRYSYMIWRHIRDVIMQKYQYSKIVHADFLGTSPSVISGNKIQLYLGTSHSVISGNKIQNFNFCLKLYDFDYSQILGISHSVIYGNKIH